MTFATEREHDRIRTVAGLLHQGCRPLRILSALAWRPEIKAAFLAKDGRELPEVEYASFDPTHTINAVREARCLVVPVTTIDLWLDAWTSSRRSRSCPSCSTARRW